MYIYIIYIIYIYVYVYVYVYVLWNAAVANLSLMTLASSKRETLLEGCRESRRCARDTFPESYITKYTSKRRLSRFAAQVPIPPPKVDVFDACI